MHESPSLAHFFPFFSFFLFLLWRSEKNNSTVCQTVQWQGHSLAQAFIFLIMNVSMEHLHELPFYDSMSLCCYIMQQSFNI